MKAICQAIRCTNQVAGTQNMNDPNLTSSFTNASNFEEALENVYKSI